ncbi:hypothetical protein [Prevotella sp. E13-27]|uniref:hypothetical protein n=1 Tax=Prevotella sp. E13-27 TaxID=2938122 RepID=UPI00200B607B|nr:hypothetical protein [Prevotella sp. E13-27]MCK8622336.1 hypothetical protein [Prevotella sp. E13-27]
MSEVQKYAPVYIPTLNRFEHFKRCLESLERCTDADKTDVYVGLDYPPSEKYVEGWKKIDKYLSEKEKKHGFKNLYVRRRDHNCGVGTVNSNSMLLLQEIRQSYDRYIITEDDNEFSPNFLSYCNWGLEYSKNDDRILAVCGFNIVETPNIKNNVYTYNKAYCAWGAAFWVERRDRMQELYDFDKIKKIVDSYPLSTVFSESIVLASSLLYMLKKRHILGDTILQAIPEDKRWCVFPKVSMVRNWGHDGSGQHGKNLDSYQRLINLPIDESLVFEPHIENDLYTQEIELAYKEKNAIPLKERVRSVLRFLIYKLTGKIVVLERPKYLK